jgi:hypothetical protein
VAELDAAVADEATLMRAAYNLKSDAALPDDQAAIALASQAAGREAKAAPRDTAGPP